MDDQDFINIFNTFYPFERYILRSPKSIEPLFDDIFITELFILTTEIKPIIDNDKLISFTEVNNNEIYLKVNGKAGEMRIGYFDFSDSIREEIIGIVITDMGYINWQSLYVQDEDEDIPDLEEMLNTQKSLIEEKYGECHVKIDTPSTRLIHI